MVSQLAAGNAQALGLSDIEVRSGLNQPLDATVSVEGASSRELDQLVIALADAEAHRRAGLERSQALVSLRFSLARDGARPVIRIRTEQPVRDPFLDFLLEVAWPGGKLVREFTVLLDPPVLAPAPAPAIAAPTAAARPRPVPSAPAATRPRAAAAPATTTTPPEKTGAAGEYGPTRANDTLWRIAQQVRPDTTLSMDQVMQSLLKANPQAFSGDNINNLKTGQILHVPAAGEMAALDAQSARRASAAQYERWRARGAPVVASKPVPAPAPTPAPAMAEAPATPAPATGKPAASTVPPAPAVDEGRLKLLPPEEAAAPAVGTVGGQSETAEAAASGTGNSPDGQPDGQDEAEATAAALEREEMKKRVDDLEKQLSDMQRVLQVKSDELAAMQRKQAAPGAAVSPSLWNDPATLALLGGFAALLALLIGIAVRRRREVHGYIEPLPPQFQQAGAAAATTSAAAPVATSSRPMNPLAEADMYLAYGRYAQAEAVIQTALAATPSNTLHLKLLEIHEIARNEAGFVEVARGLRQDATLWPQVVAIGRRFLPDHALFKGQPTVAEGATADAPHGYVEYSPPPVAGKPGTAAPALTPTALDLDMPDADDEMRTKLDLAEAYLAMNDRQGAREVLADVLKDGSGAQKREAETLMQRAQAG
jgi:pilus assembly protein FimV